MAGPEIESFFEVERIDRVEHDDSGEPVPADAVDRPSLVISLGGSLLYWRGEDGTALDVDFLSRIGETLTEMARRFRVFVVVGGGLPAKEMISALRGAGASESALDGVGIGMTRVNAMALRCVLGLKGAVVPSTLEDAIAESAVNPVVVLGGTHPGHTTDAVAAMLAEAVRSHLLIIATDVDGFFTSDPREDPNAILYEVLSPNDLVVLTASYGSGAGSRAPIDPVAARIIARSGIRTIILNGADVENLEAGASGRDCRGTTIEPEVAPQIDRGEIEARAEVERRAIGERARRRAPSERAPPGERPKGGRRLLLKLGVRDREESLEIAEEAGPDEAEERHRKPRSHLVRASRKAPRGKGKARSRSADEGPKKAASGTEGPPEEPAAPEEAPAEERPAGRTVAGSEETPEDGEVPWEDAGEGIDGDEGAERGKTAGKGDRGLRKSRRSERSGRKDDAGEQAPEGGEEELDWDIETDEDAGQEGEEPVDGEDWRLPSLDEIDAPAEDAGAETGEDPGVG